MAVAKDLTVGNPGKALISFSIPLMGSVVFQQLYNIADSFVAGKFIGDSALAAVGNAYEITLVYLAVAFGCNMGSSIVVSQLFGAKKIKDIKTAVSTNFIASGIVCVILALLGFLLSPFILRLIKTPEAIMGDTLLYLNIYTAGLPFLFFYNISNGIFSALGDSKTPFIFLAASSCANIMMDIWFVAGLDFGIAGVAWATFICQGISCVLAFVTVLLKLKKLPQTQKAPLFSFPMFIRIAGVGVPSMMQQIFVSFGNICIQGAVNSFGIAAMAGYSAAIKVNNFYITTLSTLGNAMSNYAAQNMGAGKTERVKQGFKSGLVLGISVTVVFTAAYYFFRESLIGIFINEPGEAMEIGKTFLSIVPIFYVIVCTKIVADGITRGAGAMKLFVIATTIDLIFRASLAYVFSYLLKSSTGIWLAWPVGWIIGMAISLVFYISGKWKRALPE